jgi:hypothetical protein
VRAFKSKVLHDEISLKELERKSRYYAELMTLEVNHIYRVVYGEEVNLNVLSNDTRRYLQKHYKDYYLDRIKKSDRKPRLRMLRTMSFLHNKPIIHRTKVYKNT